MLLSNTYPPLLAAIGRIGSGKHLWTGRHSWHADVRSEVKLTARARFTVHPNTASHFLNQSRSNSQSQPHTAVLTRRRAVGLGENIEDQPLTFHRYSNAGIGD